ncbi:hypothetical protein CR51_37310 [Caballeronia megalochromosomata]|nr:hypothetical protein CR51_37310 [Caballeronia megalochromosomata]
MLSVCALTCSAQPVASPANRSPQLVIESQLVAGKATPSLDNKLMLVGGNEDTTASRLVLFQTASGLELRQWRFEDSFEDTCFTPDGTKIVVLFRSGVLRTFSVFDGSVLAETNIGGDMPGKSLTCASDGLIGAYNGDIHGAIAWYDQTLQKKAQLQFSTLHALTSVAFDGETVFLSWVGERGKVLGVADVHNSSRWEQPTNTAVTSSALSAKNNVALWLDDKSVLHAVRLDRPIELWKQQLKVGDFGVIRISEHGRFAVVMAFNPTRSMIFDVANGKLVRETPDKVVQIGDDGQPTLSFSSDGQGLFYRASGVGPIATLFKTQTHAQQIRLNQPTSDTLLVSGETYDYALDSGADRLRRVEKSIKNATALPIGDPALSRYVYISQDGAVTLHDGATANRKIVLPNEARSIEAVPLSADRGVLIATLTRADRERIFSAVEQSSIPHFGTREATEDYSILERATNSVDTTLFLVSPSGVATRLAILHGCTLGLTATPDGKIAASVLGRRVTVFDTVTGQQLTSIPLDDDRYARVQLSRSGNLLAYAHGSKLDVLNVRSGLTIAHFDRGHIGDEAFVFTPNEHALLVAEGPDILTLPLDEHRPISKEPPGAKLSMEQVKAWSKSGDVFLDVHQAANRTRYARLTSLSGGILADVELENRWTASSVSDRGRFILLTRKGSSSAHGSARVYDVVKHSLGPELVLPRGWWQLGDSGEIYDDGKVLLPVTNAGEVHIQYFDGQTGQPESVALVLRDEDTIFDVQMATSPSGQLGAFIVATMGHVSSDTSPPKYLEVFDFKIGSPVYRTTLEDDPGGEMQFSPDEKSILLLVSGTLKMFNIAGAAPKIIGVSLVKSNYSFSKDGQAVFVAKATPDTPAGHFMQIEEISIVDGKSLQRVFRPVSDIDQKAWLNTASELVAWPGTDGSWTVTKLSDEDYVGTRSTFAYQSNARDLTNLSLFGQDRLAATDDDGLLVLWKIGVATPAAKAAFDVRGPWSVVTPDNRFDTDAVESSDVLHWVLPDDPLTPLPLDLYTEEYYEPDLLHKRFSGEALPPIESIEKLEIARPRISKIKLEARHSDSVDVTVVAEQGTFKGSMSEIKNMRLFRDGQLVRWVDGNLKLEDGRAVVSFRNVPLPAGTRPIEFSAYAFNKDSVRGDKVISTWTAPRSKGTRNAFIISVGVESDSNGDSKVTYAESDARLFASTMKNALLNSAEYKNVNSVMLLGTGQEHTATHAGLDALLKSLEATRVARPGAKASPHQIVSRVPGPDDLVIIYLSGHGYSEGGRFHFLLQSDEATEIDDSQDRRRAEITSDELADHLRNIDASSIVLVIDSCHSATAVAGAGFKPSPADDKGLGEIAYTKQMRVLTASQGDQLARESESYGHGLLTYALIQEGILEGRAASSDTNLLVESIWLQYAADEVPRLVASRENALTSSVAPLVPVEQRPSFFNFGTSSNDFVLLAR